MTLKSDTFTALICGSRDWRDASAVDGVIATLYFDHGDRLVIIHGDCPTGADHMARTFCEERGITQQRFPADWATHGRAAGPIRNGLMLAMGKPRIVWAFRTSNASRGTNDMIRQAMAAKLPVYVMEPDRKVCVFNDPALVAEQPGLFDGVNDAN